MAALEPPTSGGAQSASSSQRTLSRIDAAPAPRFARRFRIRVFLYMVTLAVGFSLASTGIFYWRQLGFIQRDRDRRARTLLTSLATESEIGAWAQDAELLQLAARRALAEEDVYFVAVYSRSGRELIRLAKREVPVPAPPSPAVFARLDLPAEQLPVSFAVAHEAGELYDDLYAPILTLTRDAAAAIASGSKAPRPRQEPVGMARLGLSHRPGRAQLEEMLWWGGIVAASLFGVGIVSAYLLSRRMSRPIAALIRGADRLRVGDLETRVKVESRDELGELAYSFNRMAKRLNESITALETLNRNLEGEVARRTAEVQRAADFSSLLNAPLGRRDIHPDLDPPSAIIGGDAESSLAAILDDALAALIAGTDSRGGAAFLYPDENPDRPGAQFELSLARYQAAPPEAFGEAPPVEFLEFGGPFLDGNRMVAPLLLGTEVLGCVVLLEMPQRDDTRFIGQAASQLAVAVGNVRAYAAADRLARALRERNIALARQRDQLQEMNQLKSEFLANVSHELRTPLNAIIGYSELIADGLYGGVTGEQTSALAGIDESGKNLLQLINQILDLAKVESGKMSAYLEELYIDEIARAVVAEASALAKDRPYQIGLFVDAPMRIRTDAAKVKQILTNLISNAVKFTLKGHVDVRVQAHPDGGCLITVADTGIGIRPADTRIIFEEFRQVDGSYTREFGGTGLGLAIAKRFADLLGGSISVESEVGLGSTFTLRLPREAPNVNATRMARPLRRTDPYMNVVTFAQTS